MMFNEFKGYPFRVGRALRDFESVRPAAVLFALTCALTLFKVSRKMIEWWRYHVVV